MDHELTREELEAARRYMEDLRKFLYSTGRCGDLVRDGVWQVSRDQRPRGWERMNIKESE